MWGISKQCCNCPRISKMESVPLLAEADGSPTSQTSDKHQDECVPPRKWRKNTPEEKRRQNKKRKRNQRKARTQKIIPDPGVCKATIEVKKYKGMARTFWQWELQKRKEAIQEVPSHRKYHHLFVQVSRRYTSASLHDPTIDGEVYIGRGSFSVQYYRGIKVAVKEFLPRSMKVDVTNEAAILSLLNHPYLPYIFGMCVLQYFLIV